MKFLSVFSLIFALSISNPCKAQDAEVPGVGDIYKIGFSSNYQYTHLNFPKPNFIIKKGGIANYSKLSGILVEITEVNINEKGQTMVVFRRKDGKKFFNSFSEVNANFEQAIASAELLN